MAIEDFKIAEQLIHKCISDPTKKYEQVLEYKHKKGHLENMKLETTIKVGFHLYYENHVIQNFVNKLMRLTKVSKKKKLLMMVSLDKKHQLNVGSYVLPLQNYLSFLRIH